MRSRVLGSWDDRAIVSPFTPAMVRCEDVRQAVTQSVRLKLCIDTTGCRVHAVTTELGRQKYPRQYHFCYRRKDEAYKPERLL